MRIRILLSIFLLFVQFSIAQCKLLIKQINRNADTIPHLIIANFQEVVPVKLNDSVMEYTFEMKQPEYFFVVADKHNWWNVRVWMEPEIEKREITIDYKSRKISIKDTTDWEKLLFKIDTLYKAKKHDEIYSIENKFIENRPNSFLSLWLYSYCSVLSLTQNENITLFKKLSSSLETYSIYKQSKASLTARKYPNYGDNFKEFTLNDNKEIPFNSTSINNKIIILHFWSTGCGPCVKGMDELVKFYKSLDTSKIAFISVSLDEDKSKWKKSATTNKIIWANLWTEDNSYCDLCLNYNLTAMPYFVMFNKEKKITFYNDGEDIELLKSKLKEIDK